MKKIKVSENYKRKERINKGKTMMYLIFYLGFFAMGMVAGMMLQQVITQSTLIKVADSLDGVQIDIDFNETQIVEGIMDFYTPYFEEMINKSETSDVLEVENETN